LHKAQFNNYNTRIILETRNKTARNGFYASPGISIFASKPSEMPQIENSTTNDIPEIFRLYRLAADYQRQKQTVVVWPEFAPELVETEVAEKHQWKMLIDGKIACVWATTFSDAQIWEEKNDDPAVYIHRIATNPDFRGQNFVGIIVEWAKGFALQNNKDFVRLDTIGNNTGLIKHYTNAGFTFLGVFDLKDTTGLPAHYHGAPAALFEIKLDK
jgi:ribosomal protein S18 acetylase RimI-like enzyme